LLYPQVDSPRCILTEPGRNDNPVFWMSKESSGYGVLASNTIDINAKLTNINRLLLCKPKIAHTAISQKMKENPPDEPAKDNIMGCYISAASRANKSEQGKVFVWTDGSKTKQGAGFGVFFKQNSIYNIMAPLPQHTSSAEAELIAIEAAINSGPIGADMTIFADNANHRVINRIKEAISKRRVSDQSHSIVAVFIPSHLLTLMGIYGHIDWIIEGNTQADSLALEASNLEPFIKEEGKGALNSKISDYTKKKQFNDSESTLKRKRGIQAELSITSDYLTDSLVDEQHKRTIRRAGANGFLVLLSAKAV